MKIHDALRPAAIWLGGRIYVRVRGGANSGLRWTLFPFSGYWHGMADEKDTISAIRSYVRVGAICWDLGAHFGFYSLMMAHQSGADGRVYAFEPEPLSFSRLARHIKLNHLEGRCIPFNLAASAEVGEGLMYAGGGAGVTTTHFRYIDEPAFGAEESLRVKTVRLDVLVKSGDLAPPAFIKVDVEGHAGSALEGARETMTKVRPVVLLSTHGPDESRAINEYFVTLGYQARWSLSGSPWHPDDARPEEAVVMLP
jgi:FkbM family methyltransferase